MLNERKIFLYVSHYKKLGPIKVNIANLKNKPSRLKKKLFTHLFSKSIFPVNVRSFKQ